MKNCRSGQKWVQGKVLGKIGKRMYQVKVMSITTLSRSHDWLKFITYCLTIESVIDFVIDCFCDYY